MKTIIKSFLYAISITATLSFGSCDYLEIEPEVTVPADELDFTDMSSMYSHASGAYAKVRTGGMHWVIWEITTIRDQDVFSGQNNGSDYYNLGVYKYNDAFWGLNEMWTQYYGIIKVSNAAINTLDKYVPNITNDNDMKKYKEYRAEVMYMRAYAYYRLVQGFGDVTILRENDQKNLRRSDKSLVNKYILEDLQYGMDNLPRIRPNQSTNKGAVTAFSAAMLAAKVHLNEGNYAKVEELTNDIIANGNFKLYDDYYQLFKIPGKLSDESMFEIQCTDFGNGSGDLIDAGEWFVCQGPSNSGNISGWGDCGILKSFRDWAYDRGETVRATTSFLMSDSTTPDGDYIRKQTNSSNADCWNGKAYTPSKQLTPGRTKYGTNNNVRIFRYAEVLLMSAEAKVKLGKNGDAPFNEVRRRAEMPELTNVTFAQVIDERRMELLCEWGERYNDLLRTGLAETQLKGWSKEKAYLPLPFDQVTENPSLREEPLKE